MDYMKDFVGEPKDAKASLEEETYMEDKINKDEGYESDDTTIMVQRKESQVSMIIMPSFYPS